MHVGCASSSGNVVLAVHFDLGAVCHSGPNGSYPEEVEEEVQRVREKKAKNIGSEGRRERKTMKKEDQSSWTATV